MELWVGMHTRPPFADAKVSNVRFGHLETGGTSGENCERMNEAQLDSEFRPALALM